MQAFVGPQASDEPVIVETVRSRPDGSPVTRHITIVRQGERILSVIKPEQVHSTPRAFSRRNIYSGWSAVASQPGGSTNAAILS